MNVHQEKGNSPNCCRRYAGIWNICQLLKGNTTREYYQEILLGNISILTLFRMTSCRMNHDKMIMLVKKMVMLLTIVAILAINFPDKIYRPFIYFSTKNTVLNNVVKVFQILAKRPWLVIHSVTRLSRGLGWYIRFFVCGIDLRVSLQISKPWQL